MRKLFLLISILFSININVQAAEPGLDQLFSTINERLGYMESVALYKAQNKLPVENLERENIVIADAVKAAELEGLNPDSIEEFFSAQIAVAKAIQYRYRAELLSTQNPSQAADLDDIVRPAISKLGKQIVTLLANCLKSTETIKATDIEYFNQSINTRFVTTLDKKMLFGALLKARLN